MARWKFLEVIGTNECLGVSATGKSVSLRRRLSVGSNPTAPTNKLNMTEYSQIIDDGYLHELDILGFE